MNMISTGAFQTEMDASNKQPTLAEKFAAVWEKKNAKAARAGGVSLMALSLAACGSDDTTSSSDSTTTTTTTTSNSKLTNETDTISASGVIDAGMVWSPGGNTRTESLQSEDTVTGTGTADTINITTDGGTIAPKLINVETINFSVAGATAGTLNVSNSSGYSSVALSSTDGDVGVTGMASGVAVSVNDVADAATNAFAAMTSTAVTGSSTAVTVSVDGFIGTNINVGASAAANTAGTGVETLTLSSSGETSSIASLGSSGATTVNVNAAAQTTVSAFTATGITTLDASGSTATTSLNVAANIGANDFTYTGGSGNDTLIANSGFGGLDTLDGGAGSNTLSIRPLATSGDVTVGALGTGSVVKATNWQTLDLRNQDGAGNFDFTVDMDTIPSVTAITMRAGDINNTTEFNLVDLSAAQGGALTLTMNGTGATVATNAQVDVDLKDATGTTDEIVLNITTSADDDATPANNQNITVNDDTTNNAIEKLTVNLSGSFGVLFDQEAAAFGTQLKVTGGAADQDFATATAFQNTTIDMSGVVSDVVFTTGGTTQTVTTGSGADTITLDAGSKTVDLGAGDDTLVTGTTAIGNVTGNVDSFNGGDGTDTLHVEGTFTNSGTVMGQVSNFEVLRLDTAGTQAVSMANFTNNAGFTRITIDQLGGGTATITNASTSLNTIRIEDGAAADTVAFSRLVDGSADALTIDARGGAITVAAITASDEETITITTNSAADDQTITTLTAADLTTLNVSGAGDVIVSNAIASATGLATVSATGATGAVTLNASNSSTAITATGNTSSSGVFTFTGGNKGDTINGGGGGDTLNGGAGADTISGGGGADTITGGDGIDTVTGGAGADTFSFAATLAAGSRDTVTDFATGTDIIGLVNANTSDGTAAGAAAVLEDEAAAAANVNGAAYDLATALTATTNAIDLATLDGAVLTNIANADLTAATDGTELLKALVAAGAGNTAASITLDGDHDLYLATDDGVNGYLYHLTGGGNSAVIASEITLIATFTGDADFGDILAANTVIV